jgi:hypothetical protein
MPGCGLARAIRTVEERVSQPELIDSLIATYRTLNMTVRPIAPEQAAQMPQNGQSLLEMVGDLRQKEIAASQALKLMALGETAFGVGDGTVDSADQTPPSANPTNVRVLLSEFGTAREAILAYIRELPAEEWTKDRASFHGATSVQQLVTQVVERDRQVLAQMQALLPSHS